MKIITVNKRAYFDYEVLEKYEAGIVLTGDEVKSVRQGMVGINEAFATFQEGELFLLNGLISPYTHAFTKTTDTGRRTRKLLLHRKEIDKLIGAIARKGLTIIPLRLYFNEKSYVKVELGIARCKKLVDKRQSIKEKELKREASRAIKTKLR
jgi:SsrA-binding protein